MSKWTEYTQKEALKDNDELMILDTDGKANKRTLLDKVWNYVVDKMTTAVIAKLETTNKTLIGAVNELNSNPGTPLTKPVYKDNTYTVSVKDSECIRMVYFVNSQNYSPVEVLICKYKNQNCTVSTVFNGNSNNYLETSINGDYVIFTFKSGGVITLTSNIK